MGFDFIIKGSKDIKEEDILSLALDRTDSYGKPFQVVDLILNHPISGYERFHGFEGTILYYRKGDRAPAIKYALPRPLVFEADSMGIGKGRLSCTAHNLKMMASHWRDNIWTIKDEVIRARVKKMAGEYKMLDKDKAAYEKRLGDAQTVRRSEGPVDIQQKNSIQPELVIAQGRINMLAKQNEELLKRLKAHDLSEKTLAAREENAVTPDGEPVPTEDVLRNETWMTLKKRCKTLGILNGMKEQKKLDLIDALLRYYDENRIAEPKEEPEQVEV